MERKIDTRLKEIKIKEYKKFSISFAIGMLMLLGFTLYKDLHLIFIILSSIFLFTHLLAYFFYPFLAIPMFYLTRFSGKIFGALFVGVIFSLIFYSGFLVTAIFIKLLKKDVISNISKYPEWILIDPEDKVNDPKNILKMY